MSRSRLILVAIAVAVLSVAAFASLDRSSAGATTTDPIAYRFIAWGDMRPGSAALHASYSPGWRHVRDKMASLPHAFEVVLGDMVNVTASDTLDTVNGKYADFFAALGTTRSKPKSYVTGNHEAVGVSDAAVVGWETNIHKTHYGTFSWGQGTAVNPRVRVINLSTNEPGYLGYIGYDGETSTSNSAQAAWLVSILRTHASDPYTYLVVSMHHPLADNKTAAPYDLNANERTGLQALFGKYGVDLVMSGDIHAYCRHMMADGTPYLIQGMAGAEPNTADFALHHDPGTDARRIGSADATHKQYGFTRFQVTTTGRLVADTYVTTEGTWSWRIADSFEVKQQAPTGGSAVPTPTPTPTPAADFQPSAPYYATFFYPWYKNAATDGAYSYWQDHANTPPTSWFSHFLPDRDPSRFDPASELYSSFDYATFKWELSKMAEARQEVAIASWFGKGTKQDAAIDKYLHDFMKRSDNPYPNLRFAMYYEHEGFADPSVSELVSDLSYIKNNYATSPYFLKVNGKPVIFVYGGASDGLGTSQRWKEANAQVGNAFYYVLKVYDGYSSDPNQPSSWHQYAPASRYNSYAGYSDYVSPGFWWDAPGQTVRLARNLSEFSSAVTQMVNDGTKWKLVETWNEWGEGSSVEPGTQARIDATGREVLDPNGATFGNAYVRALADRLPPLEAGTGR